MLLFRASEDGWTPEDFHSRCDNKGATLSLFKIQDGDCIGGFTTAQWSSNDDDFGSNVSDSEAMLFNLTCQRYFPSIKDEAAIFQTGTMGPYFGYDELLIGAPFNGEEKCTSNPNSAGFQIPVDAEGVNMLTNQKNNRFTISEFEVWQIEYI